VEMRQNASMQIAPLRNLVFVNECFCLDALSLSVYLEPPRVEVRWCRRRDVIEAAV
jgi:hypothetical protein